MPAIPFVSIDADDDSVDFGRFKPATNGTKANGIVTVSETTTTTPTSTTSTTSSPRTLLLAPPSFAAHEEKLRALFATYDRDTADLQMLDRLAAGLVPLAAGAYGRVLVLTDADGGCRAEALALLSRRGVYAALVPAMQTGARLQLQDGSRLDGADAREAILAGLVPGAEGAGDNAFTKAEEEEVVVPLRRLGKNAGQKTQTPTPAPAPTPTPAPAPALDLGEYSDGDELVDEDSLLTAEERNRPPQQPPQCNIDGQKRRKPCKDCTCGLAERLQDEDQARRAQADSALKLSANDLNELDFTVAGKTGSCNSCSLGDAFRCSTCPYIGLPAFQPGEEVKILSGLVQL